ncbi:hypothetical protein [Streptomyces cacaoi]|uniref:Uncharacterized protein n=1 Tax=Streptomyces cacaoi TaxID=1898 RepID=A0A4Y3R7G6_STRCI|nr:hypothetical protein [Streptomyces cacaoi]GEB53561.1 hypothetical protein SCA03_61120 [Streptomyces cacaoi]
MTGTRTGRDASVAGMRERDRASGVVGCLTAVVAAAVGFGVWRSGAGPGLRGGFEGERDLSLLYGELPLLLFGTPVLTLVAWRLTGALLSGRAGRAARTAVPAAVACLTVALLAWAGHAWLDARVASFVQPGR